MVAIDLFWEGDLMKLDYTVGIHNDGGYEELDSITLNNPVSIGDRITMEHGDYEWQVFDIVHPPEYSIIHVKSPE